MCAFCDLVANPSAANVVLDDDATFGFLDHRPLFKGHTLVIPKRHFETLADLPDDEVERYFRAVRVVNAAVERAMEAQGTFVAMNNKVSQSVPHLHTHVVPRRRKDGLRGFFWPRTRYDNDGEAAAVASAIRRAIEEGAR